MKLKIGILGSRGIPNAYGGFEQFAEELSVRLLRKGHEVHVYNSTLHPYKNSQWHGVNLIRCTDWEDKLGAMGQFIYDWNCISDSRKRNFDIVLQLGYTSNSVWYWRWPKTPAHIVNMDGLEWKRTQYSRPVRQFIKKAESLAATHADYMVADSVGIQEHIFRTYNKTATFIPYAAQSFTGPDASVLNAFPLQPNSYYLAVSRLEPENNIEMIIKGYLNSKMDHNLVVVGTVNSFGRKLQTKYASDSIKFLGPVYNKNTLNNLRYFCKLHFHGHSVGGTNPSLLEAMACQANIAAHDNIFNKAVLGTEAEYFTTSNEITHIIDCQTYLAREHQRKMINVQKIVDVYNWDRVVDAYERLMFTAIAVKPAVTVPVFAHHIA
jgi:glycosyltransferase involved in cell wall biosynthesis